MAKETQVHGASVAEVTLNAYEHAYEQGWTDGLPIIPPSEELVQRFVAASSRVAQVDIGDAPAFLNIDAGGAGVVEQEFVEGGAPDLVRVRVGAVGFAEVPTPGFAIGAPDHRRSALLGEAGLLDRG